MNQKILITKLTTREKAKIDSDLKFLKNFLIFTQKQNFRVIISGGYALDGVLGKVTRPHNDLDMIVYTQLDRFKAGDLIQKYILNIYPQASINLKQNQFMQSIAVNVPNFGADIYLVQTQQNPFINLNSIIRQDGKVHVNSKKVFLLQSRLSF